MNILCEVQGLEKTYGRRRVVSGVSMTVGESEIVGLLGPNGAGKSTSFKMTCGIVRPDRGKVFLSGKEVTDWPLFRRASEGGMGYLAQESSVFRKLSVEQNILAVFELLGVRSRDANCGHSGYWKTLKSKCRTIAGAPSARALATSSCAPLFSVVSVPSV